MFRCIDIFYFQIVYYRSKLHVAMMRIVDNSPSFEHIISLWCDYFTLILHNDLFFSYQFWLLVKSGNCNQFLERRWTDSFLRLLEKSLAFSDVSENPLLSQTPPQINKYRRRPLLSPTPLIFSDLSDFSLVSNKPKKFQEVPSKFQASSKQVPSCSNTCTYLRDTQ